jgi:NADPH:quinone reductase
MRQPRLLGTTQRDFVYSDSAYKLNSLLRTSRTAQALGNSREAPAFTFSGPNSRHDKNRVVTRHTFKRLASRAPTERPRKPGSAPRVSLACLALVFFAPLREIPRMTTEKLMNVVEITRFGPPDVLALRQREIPTPKSDEVLIKIEAAGVSRPDVLQRRGHYHPPTGASDLPGLEAAGVIAACGPGVSEYKLGDQICALLAGGGYAEFCVAPVSQVLPIPSGWSAQEAATLPENMFTVWENAFRRAKLQAGETILIQGGTSGIGSTAIMLAREFGATVIATAGTDEKCQACVSIGANAAINYKTQDFVIETLRLTGQSGVDVVLDIVGGAYVQRSINCIATNGRISLLAIQGGDEATFLVSSLIKKRGTILASNMRPRSPAEKGLIAEDLRRQVWPRLSSRTNFRPIIDRVFKFAEAPQAHERMERGEHVGKIVLIP